MKMYICVDFDGTIVDHRFPFVGSPVPGAVVHIKRWIEAGAKIILFTMRSGEHLDEAVEFMESVGIELHGINRNPDQDSWTSSPKAYGHIYVDDAAFGCPMIQPKNFDRPCVDWSIVGPGIDALLDIQERQALARINRLTITDEGECLRLATTPGEGE